MMMVISPAKTSSQQQPQEFSLSFVPGRFYGFQFVLLVMYVNIGVSLLICSFSFVKVTNSIEITEIYLCEWKEIREVNFQHIIF